MKESSNSTLHGISTSVARLISRDEMNLAEFPLTVLSTRINTNVKTLEFEDSVKGKNGELINRKWIITGADKFGLPTASDEEVLLGLLKLTVDDELKNRKVFFTRYELLRILRWPTEGRNYSRLQKALDRLSGVRIKATNAFYDNEAKNHSTRNFGIIDGYEVNDGRDVEHKGSFFVWSDVLFKSFQAGFIKKLDLDFYLDLKSAVSKRLYRYLDKHFWYKSRVQIDLMTLAHEKLGISRNYRYVSSLRQQLDPAVQELVDRDFLASCEVVLKGKGADIVFYAKSGKARVVESQKHIPPDSNGNDSRRGLLVRMLMERGIKESQAEKLIGKLGADLLSRAKEIIEYFDTLCASGSQLVIKSPVGFLYRAIENPLAFSLPGDAKRAMQGSLNLKKTNRYASFGKEKAENDESLYLVERKRELQRLREEVSPDLLEKISREVETALDNIRGLISPERFGEVISHGIEEKLAKLFALPDFAEWKRSKHSRKPMIH